MVSPRLSGLKRLMVGSAPDTQNAAVPYGELHDEVITVANSVKNSRSKSPLVERNRVARTLNPELPVTTHFSCGTYLPEGRSERRRVNQEKFLTNRNRRRWPAPGKSGACPGSQWRRRVTARRRVGGRSAEVRTTRLRLAEASCCCGARSKRSKISPLVGLIEGMSGIGDRVGGIDLG